MPVTPQLTLPPWILNHLFWLAILGYVLLTMVNQLPSPDIDWTAKVWRTYFFNVFNSLAARATHVIPGAGTAFTQTTRIQTPTETLVQTSEQHPTLPAPPPA